ncbi:MAG: FMN-binding protein [Christensenellales bacterium]
MREVLKLSWKLVVIAVAAAVLLGFTNYMTKQPIAEQVASKNEMIRQQVLPEGQGFEEIDLDALRTSAEWNERFDDINFAYKAANGAGYVVDVTAIGYAGPMQVIVGIESSGALAGVMLGEHSETPGLGSLAGEDNYLSQFTGKTDFPLDTVKGATYADHEISAVTGATATSDHMTGGVNVAHEFFRKLLVGGEESE